MDEIERRGVSICEMTFAEMGFIFREQTILDYGIDAIIESKTEVYASGQLTGVQIKSGNSYLKEYNDEAYIYRGDMKHYFYWLNHCLPVIIILVDIENKRCYWQRVEKQLITITGTGWKIEIPKANVLSESKELLKDIIESQSEYEKRYNTLLFSKEWIKKAKDYEQLILEVDEWINKTSGKGDFRLFAVDSNKTDKIFEQTYWGFGTREYSLVIKDMFPWANISIDEDYYDLNMDNQWYDGMEESISEFEKEMRSLGKAVPLRDKSIYPYCNIGNEVDRYRLVLTLNEIGESFLILEKFLTEGTCYFLE